MTGVRCTEHGVTSFMIPSRKAFFPPPMPTVKNPSGTSRTKSYLSSLKLSRSAGFAASRLVARVDSLESCFTLEE